MQNAALKNKSRIHTARIRSVRWFVKPAPLMPGQRVEVAPHEPAERLDIGSQIGSTKK
jgi:hypothetical protein